MNTSVEFNPSTHSPGQKTEGHKVRSLLQGWGQRLKTHTYQASGAGVDFVLEASSESPKEFYMTAHKSGVKKSDSIKIRDSSRSQTYEVLEVDYYSEPSDMWMAHLVLVG
ncbi:MAG: hypothetical protein AAF329_05320 [Cyanobacteria bacterium P01_A01_bin.17]